MTDIKKMSGIKRALSVFGELFAPVIPGLVTAGMCAGFASLIEQSVPDLESHVVWNMAHTVLSLVNASFMAYMNAWIGYSACKRFGGTAILGGMLGMIGGLDGIYELSKTLGLYDSASPSLSLLAPGSGGILAAILGAFFIARIEKFVHKHMIDELDIVVTPFLTLVTAVLPYLFVIMPLTGFLSKCLNLFIGMFCESDKMLVRLLSGYVLAATFLIPVLFGMQYAFIAIYSLQLENMGYVTLFPVLAMAGAGQVGAGIALYIKAKRTGKKKAASLIGASIIPGTMGVATPLLYGITLPMGKPFVTSCLGAGFGGAFTMTMRVASTGWGASGLLAIPLMTAGESGAVRNIAYYLTGLSISCVMGFVFTMIAVREDEPCMLENNDIEVEEL